MRRHEWNNPWFGFAVPWLIIIVVIGFAQPFCRPAQIISSTTCAVIFEALHAYTSANQALDQRPSSPSPDIDRWRLELIRKQAISAMLSGRFSEAVSAFDRIAVLHNERSGDTQPDYFVLLNRGICFQKQGQVMRARADWAEAIQVMPGRHDAWLAMGHSRLLEGDYLGAHADYHRAMIASGYLGLVYVDVGDAWRAVGWIDTAHRMYRDGLARDPGEVFCHLRLAELALVRENDPEQALHIVETVRKMMPDLAVVNRIEHAALAWSPDRHLSHIPAARFESGPASRWSISPTKILFEYFREEWTGWKDGGFDAGF
ncbi:hypothetical protein JXA80_00720 [bacterium]|nr:hypothetical protein [candidate division CSSED10-310 bacterium]